MQCKNCGYHLEDDSTFCTACGAKLEAEPLTVDFSAEAKAELKVGEYIHEHDHSFAGLKATARKQIKGNILVLFVVSTIWYFILMGLEATNYFAYEFDSGNGFLYIVGLGATIVAVLLIGIMQFGLIENSDRMYKKEQPTIAASFCGFKGHKRAFLAIGTCLLMFAYAVLWSFLLFIPGIIKSYSYACSMYILHDDPTMPANDCITKSREIMNGNKLRLFLYDLYFLFLILIFVPITLGLGLIYLIPYFTQFRYNFYKSIKK